MTRNTTRSIARRAGLAALAGGVLLAAGGCVLTVTSGVQPEIKVTCPDRTVQAVVKNTDSVAHRYTVTVAVRHDEMTEDVLLSSESVAAGRAWLRRGRITNMYNAPSRYTAVNAPWAMTPWAVG